jgi:hypothetical protein
MSYHYYSPLPSGGLWATKEGTCDTSESEATLTQIQRASASSYVKSALHLDPSTSSSVFNSRKCNMAATNVERDPQRTLLVTAAPDIDAAREDDPSTLPSTKPRTRVAEVYKASSSASASHCAASSTLSYLVALSRQSASHA